MLEGEEYGVFRTCGNLRKGGGLAQEVVEGIGMEFVEQCEGLDSA